jgi:hypothetical protein
LWVSFNSLFQFQILIPPHSLSISRGGGFTAWRVDSVDHRFLSAFIYATLWSRRPANLARKPGPMRLKSCPPFQDNPNSFFLYHSSLWRHCEVFGCNDPAVAGMWHADQYGKHAYVNFLNNFKLHHFLCFGIWVPCTHAVLARRTGNNTVSLASYLASPSALPESPIYARDR